MDAGVIWPQGCSVYTVFIRGLALEGKPYAKGNWKGKLY